MAPTQQQAKQARAQQLAGSKKTPKARVQRYLKSTESQLKEVRKSVLLLRGMKTSANMMAVLKELRAMQAPAAKLLTKKNPIAVLNDYSGQQSLEFLMTKNDCALFAMATHNKKRPNNLIIGRTFDRLLLDAAELGVTYFKSMNDFGGTVPKKRVGSKPLLLFRGDVWQQQVEYRNLQNLLTDFYRGDVVDKLIATGIDHIIVFTAAQDPRLANASNSSAPVVRIHQRTYFVQLKKNPTVNVKTPAAYLTPCGPDFDFVLRRTQWCADPEVAAAARRQPNRRRSKKNKTTNLFGETVGRLHLEKQNVDRLGGRKSKALRRADKAEREEERAAIEADLEREEQDMARERDIDHDGTKSKSKH
jgi:ribosome production factor 2